MVVCLLLVSPCLSEIDASFPSPPSLSSYPHTHSVTHALTTSSSALISLGVPWFERSRRQKARKGKRAEDEGEKKSERTREEGRRGWEVWEKFYLANVRENAKRQKGEERKKKQEQRIRSKFLLVVVYEAPSILYSVIHYFESNIHLMY